jgi:hypothetical protein
VNKILDAVKDREGLEWPGGRLTYRKSKDSQEMDWENMAIALEHNFIKDADARSKLEAEYLKTVKGSRRIWFSSDESFGGDYDEAEADDYAA